MPTSDPTKTSEQGVDGSPHVYFNFCIRVLEKTICMVNTLNQYAMQCLLQCFDPHALWNKTVVMLESVAYATAALAPGNIEKKVFMWTRDRRYIKQCWGQIRWSTSETLIHVRDAHVWWSNLPNVPVLILPPLLAVASRIRTLPNPYLTSFCAAAMPDIPDPIITIWASSPRRDAMIVQGGSVKL